jgi:hypothetical protein
MLRHHPAERIPAAAGRERKDDFGQRTGLTERIACFRGQRQGSASGNEISAVHCVVLSDLRSGLLQQTAAHLKMTGAAYSAQRQPFAPPRIFVDFIRPATGLHRLHPTLI